MDESPKSKKPHALRSDPFFYTRSHKPISETSKDPSQKRFPHNLCELWVQPQASDLKSSGPDGLNGFPDFCFQTIPDGLPVSDMDATQNIPALCQSTSKHCFLPFFNLLQKLLSDDHVPPVSCIISDGVTSFTLKASQHFGLPNVAFWTFSACSFMCYKVCKNLMERDLTPLKDASYLTNGYLDTIIDWIPGTKDIKLRDLPNIYRTTDPNDALLNFVVQQIEAATRASAIILPTFDALEPEMLTVLSSMYPKLHIIGPLDLLLDNQTYSQNNNSESIKCNLWKEESECLKWLDSKEPSSVLYVNFGTVIVMRPQQLIEYLLYPYVWQNLKN